MIRINNVHLPLDYNDETIKNKTAKELRIDKNSIKNISIFRRSIDARKKDNIYFLCTVDVNLSVNEDSIIRKSKNAVKAKPYEYNVPKWRGGASPLIVGMGPAGLFAALILAQSGAKPIVIERGKDVDSRTQDVDIFWKCGKLNTNSNVQFGEGGAGTFSDGKLNTGTKDNRQRKVLEEFVKHGAPQEILYNAKPHIGTDKLKNTVKNIREEIISLGGAVFFETKLIGFNEENGKIKNAVVEKNGKTDIIETDNIILAIGHSARDTFYMLHERELSMNPKAFAIGVRVEHLAHLINESQYGEGYPEEVPTASYKLTHQCKGTGRGIYSFCMCPGGYVVNSSSEKGRLCVNGMSYHDRAGHNSNTALITTVTPDDFPSDSPLAGLEFQRKYEELAYKIGNGKIPVQLFGDFLKNQMSTKLGKVTPSIKGEWQFANLHECLPDYVCASLEEGMRAFGHKIKGYDAEDTVFSGVETRTSSPLRMERNKQFESNIQGLFPCGEGAGYAGGITSAAMDGIKTAEAIAEKILTQN